MLVTLVVACMVAGIRGKGYHDPKLGNGSMLLVSLRHYPSAIQRCRGLLVILSSGADNRK